MTTKAKFEKAKKELVADGWEQISSVMSDTGGLRYGSQFLKDGKVFFLNKDTYMEGFTGVKMAEICLPIFNFNR